MNMENKRKHDSSDVGFKRAIETFANSKECRRSNLNGYVLIETNLIDTVAVNYLLTRYSLINCLHIIFVYGSVAKGGSQAFVKGAQRVRLG